MDKNPRTFLYWAFLSYSHKDEKWARKIHRILENFRIPKSNRLPNFEKPESARFLRPVFRDKDELAASSSLSGELVSALDASRHLIVICSRDSAQSKWVAAELQHFLDQGRVDDVLYIAIGDHDDTTENLLPPPVFERGLHPLVVDARQAGESLKKSTYRLIARILNVRFDELWLRSVRRTRLLVASGLVFAAVIGGGLYIQEAKIQSLDTDEQIQRFESYMKKEIWPVSVFSRQDLNNDGYMDFAYVAQEKSGFCGSGGCASGVVLGARSVSGFKHVLELFNEEDFRSGPDSINGYLTIRTVKYGLREVPTDPSNAEPIYNVYTWTKGAYKLARYEYCAGIAFAHCRPVEIEPVSRTLSLRRGATIHVRPSISSKQLHYSDGKPVRNGEAVGKLKGKGWYLVHVWKGSSGFASAEVVAD